jgi:RNA polymerase sigma-70 factor (ECF subfamily)
MRDRRWRSRPTTSDEVLVHSFIGGDEDAFPLLVRRHQGRLYNICLRVVRDREDAMDLTQEAFARIAERISGFAGASTFSTWSHRLTINLCLDFLRRKKARPEAPLAEDEHVLEPADSRPGPEELAVGRVDGVPLWEAVAALDEDYRQVVVLADVEGISMDEIAQALDIPVGTVKSRLHRARARLLAALEGRVEPPSVRRHAEPSPGPDRRKAEES